MLGCQCLYEYKRAKKYMRNVWTSNTRTFMQDAYCVLVYNTEAYTNKKGGWWHWW